MASLDVVYNYAKRKTIAINLFYYVSTEMNDNFTGEIILIVLTAIGFKGLVKKLL